MAKEQSAHCAMGEKWVIWFQFPLEAMRDVLAARRVTEAMRDVLAARRVTGDSDSQDCGPPTKPIGNDSGKR